MIPRAALLAALCTLVAVPAQDPPPSVPALLQAARADLAAGDAARARAAIDRALERDPVHLDALLVSAAVARALDDVDRAVHDLHSWLALHDARPRAQQDRRARRKVEAELLALDPDAERWSQLVRRYVQGLSRLGRDYQKREDWLGALEAWSHLLEVDPTHDAARRAIADVRRTGGSEVAVEDVFGGGGDPTQGLSAAEIAALDARHADWEHAFTKETDNYRYRTDAGLLVLETAAIAMEQMNRFYRRFFRFKEDGGKTPQIEIRIFRNRDEYLTLGSSPVEWSGGQFTGSAVETYVGGVTGEEGIRSMYQTLFHEAAHQFVSLTGPFVPGWLNEAYASFFEGCTILSNGTVRWNQVPPGRLFPLARRLEHGWMSGPEEAHPDADGEFREPEGAPTLRMVVEGRYPWGPPWYAPTWGVVYFLYNYRDADGRTVYRDALHAYYESFVRGRPEDPVAHFEATVLTAERSPVRSIDELSEIWKTWILGVRDRETGKGDAGAELLRWATAALERDEPEQALEFYEEARDFLGSDPDLLWSTAAVLEDLRRKARAAATYREFVRELDLRGITDDPRRETAVEKVLRLDSLAHRYRLLKKELAEDGLALARAYEERGLPTMALEIARRMSASFSVPEALAYYVALAERTGKSLARWRVAYNEQNLDGWSGDADHYQAYGAHIRAHVPSDGDAMVTHMLTCDVAFDADYSLEAEMRIEITPDGDFAGRLMGLCFGRKGDQDYHAVFLHPDGFLDVSTNRGGDWTIRDHRSVPVGAGTWHRLRIDVTGDTLDVFLDGLYVRSLEFPSPAVVRGGFGLITGPGDAAYRNVRILARDPHDPAARIERRLAMQKVLADASLRQPGQFSGFAPPEPDVSWLRGEPTTLAELRGHPVLLVFWTPAQERVIPTAHYIAHLIEKGRAAGLETIVVSDGGTPPGEVRAQLEKTPIDGARIALDKPGGPTYDRYFVKPGHHGLPRFLLLRADGRVVFEGDPGFASGSRWEPGGAPTYVDAAFDELLSGR